MTKAAYIVVLLGLVAVAQTSSVMAGELVQEEPATFTARELLAANHTGLEGFQYTNIRLETSTPVDTFNGLANSAGAASAASSNSDSSHPWGKHKSADQVTQPTNPSLPLLNSQSQVEASDDDPDVLEKRRELLLKLLEDTEAELASQN